MRPWLVQVCCVCIPLAIGAPIALILRNDAGARSSASERLEREISAIEPRIADLADFHHVRARLLPRRQVVAELESHPVRAADGLGFLRRLPRAVELVSLERTGARLTLAIRGADNDVAAVVDLLAPSGYRDARIAARAPSADGALAATIEATATRSNAK